MTESEHAATGTRELPLFPLSTVLFPGATLPLHIFEQRYRAMVKRCLGDARPEFVVLLIKDGPEVQEGVKKEGVQPVAVPADEAVAAATAAPHPVGTVARIVNAGRFPDGRYLIVCVGHERIRLRRVVQERPYLVGEVEALPDEDTGGGEAARRELTGQVRQAMTDLLTAIREASPPGDAQQRLQVDAVARSIPTAAVELSFFVPRVLGRASAEERQRILDSRSLRTRLRLELRLLSREQDHVQRLKRSGTPLRFDAGATPPSMN